MKIVDELDIKEKKFTIEDVVLPLVGSNVDYPTGSSCDFLLDLLEEDGISERAFERIGDKEISLCGDYRKLMCKPTDVSYSVKMYYDPLQPLLNTDLMELSGATVETKEAKKVDEAAMIGMLIGFTLPPSAYATIALRELTKRPTSSDYQSKLELNGKCERNLV